MITAIIFSGVVVTVLGKIINLVNDSRKIKERDTCDNLNTVKGTIEVLHTKLDNHQQRSSEQFGDLYTEVGKLSGNIQGLGSRMESLKTEITKVLREEKDSVCQLCGEKPKTASSRKPIPSTIDIPKTRDQDSVSTKPIAKPPAPSRKEPSVKSSAANLGKPAYVSECPDDETDTPTDLSHRETKTNNGSSIQSGKKSTKESPATTKPVSNRTSTARNQSSVNLRSAESTSKKRPAASGSVDPGPVKTDPAESGPAKTSAHAVPSLPNSSQPTKEGSTTHEHTPPQAPYPQEPFPSQQPSRPNGPTPPPPTGPAYHHECSLTCRYRGLPRKDAGPRKSKARTALRDTKEYTTVLDTYEIRGLFATMIAHDPSIDGPRSQTERSYVFDKMYPRAIRPRATSQDAMKSDSMEGIEIETLRPTGSTTAQPDPMQGVQSEDQMQGVESKDPSIEDSASDNSDSMKGIDSSDDGATEATDPDSDQPMGNTGATDGNNSCVDVEMEDKTIMQPMSVPTTQKPVHSISLIAQPTTGPAVTPLKPIATTTPSVIQTPGSSPHICGNTGLATKPQELSAQRVGNGASLLPTAPVQVAAPSSPEEDEDADAEGDLIEDYPEDPAQVVQYFNSRTDRQHGRYHATGETSESSNSNTGPPLPAHVGQTGQSPAFSEPRVVNCNESSRTRDHKGRSPNEAAEAAASGDKKLSWDNVEELPSYEDAVADDRDGNLYEYVLCCLPLSSLELRSTFWDAVPRACRLLHLHPNSKTLTLVTSSDRKAASPVQPVQAPSPHPTLTPSSPPPIQNLSPTSPGATRDNSPSTSDMALPSFPPNFWTALATSTSHHIPSKATRPKFLVPGVGLWNFEQSAKAAARAKTLCELTRVANQPNPPKGSEASAQDAHIPSSADSNTDVPVPEQGAKRKATTAGLGTPSNIPDLYRNVKYGYSAPVDRTEVQDPDELSNPDAQSKTNITDKGQEKAEQQVLQSRKIRPASSLRRRTRTPKAEDFFDTIPPVLEQSAKRNAATAEDFFDMIGSVPEQSAKRNAATADLDELADLDTDQEAHRSRPKHVMKKPKVGNAHAGDGSVDEKEL